MNAYFEMLESYIEKYLHVSVNIVPAEFAAATKFSQPNLEYLNYLRNQVATSFDSYLAMVDAKFSVVDPSCEFCNGENFFTVKPNFAVASVRNYKEVEAISSKSTGLLRDRWYAEMMGIPTSPGPGISALAVGGHELLHFILLKEGGASLSLEIDGGPLSGLTLLDYNLNAISVPNYQNPNFRWAVQRVSLSQPALLAMGAYLPPKPSL